MHWIRNHQRVRASLFLGFSFALALLVGILVWTSVSAIGAEIEYWRNHEEKATVIVASHTLGQGHPIGVEDLALREVPIDYVANSALRDQSQVLHRVPMERILAGEMIRPERLAPIERGESMAALIPRGLRALTVNLRDGAAMSGFLEPGNWVDVLVTVRAGDGVPSETVTLLQTVRVLTVDEKLSRDGEVDAKKRRKPAITLLVTPEEAEKLTHAVAQGDVDLVLRNDVDVTEHEGHGATSDDLLGRPEQRIDVRRWRKDQQESGDGASLFIRGGKQSWE